MHKVGWKGSFLQRSLRMKQKTMKVVLKKSPQQRSYCKKMNLLNDVYKSVVAGNPKASNENLATEHGKTDPEMFFSEEVFNFTMHKSN